MKSLLIALLALPALAAHFTGVGEFYAPHEIAVFGYQDEASCSADEGRWEEELCWFKVEDEVIVKDDNAGSLDVVVNTVTTNGHSCSFEGKGKFTNEGTILATAPSEDWSGDESVPATCEVTLTFVDGNTVDVSNGGESCSYFCGARATLDISGAKRR
jgi:hypothetical protein